ncbi:MAG: SDR family NAD(P)-dependent oxidoreductase [Okeania sp. SIO3I5]|uniref:SDR family NAD(P)-dependent oxidoreductase n=1 Tax=Okeania sp. SIO3I5 TaxID=2607805 RepID=UPI0013B97B7A|nr:SDR family NAD(P)-dependent oxidoreductase [Okeania sp. SIO3I5]NEQ40126.1 SDR family NAD(P)-dependent oxidoreductase [Okeania sp. SIO3I5]
MSQGKFLQNRIAIVTGGTSGIGKAIAIALAESGANVAVGSRSASTSSCQAEIESEGVKALVMNLDVSSTDSVQAFYDATIKVFDKVDIALKLNLTKQQIPIAIRQPRSTIFPISKSPSQLAPQVTKLSNIILPQTRPPNSTTNSTSKFINRKSIYILGSCFHNHLYFFVVYIQRIFVNALAYFPF